MRRRHDQLARELPSAVLTHQPALDGLRAVAILLVLGYHARLPGFTHGDLGVDVFFELSGFLITTMIFSEIATTGAFSFRVFYARRFVRLFPAYFLLLLACLAATAVRGYSGTLRGAALSFFYIANWGAAQSQGLGLLRHTWSLSIEEQFYIIWPATLVLLIRLLRARAVALALSISTLILVSYGLSLLALSRGTALIWVANATPTRSGMLLVGALLAVALARWSGNGSTRAWLPGLDLAGGIGLAALLGVAMFRVTTTWNLVGVVWPIVALATAATVAASVLRPKGRLARVLSLSPLIAIGRRSYGIYLWQYPVFLVLDTEFRGLGAGQVLVGSVLTLALAAASYRFVEQPLIASFRARRRRDPDSRAYPVPGRPVEHQKLSPPGSPTGLSWGRPGQRATDSG